MPKPRALLIVTLCGALLGACADNPSQTSEGAKRGAKSGAIGGAAGGLVSALIFGGDPITRAAQGAAVGAASGAAVGAASGAERDKKQRATMEAEYGKENYEGLRALAACDYAGALELARQGQQSKDRYHALSGIWLEAISYGDRGDYDTASSYFPSLIQQDPDILDANDAEKTLRDSIRKLRNIRFEQGLAAQCDA
jgi:hypothetical protein